MRIFRHYKDLSDDVRHGVVALGNFDGVHRGHSAVIAAAKKKAHALNAPAWVMSFEPHPRQFFDPNQKPFMLTPFRNKAHLLEQQGVDCLLLQQFDQAFSRHSAASFAKEVLVDSLRARHVVVGKNYAFGYKREGNIETLRLLGEQLGFSLEALDPVCLEDGTPCSSTRIRKALQAGDVALATRMLGRFWEIEGRVEHGEKRGRTIGFPTANIRLSDYLHPALGVYATLVMVDRNGDQSWHPAVANIGTRPTFGDHSPLIEVHLLGFSGDLYGCHLRVGLVEYLRSEQKFPDLQALKQQISHDAETARHLLEHHLPVVGARTL